MEAHQFCPYCMNPIEPGQSCKACGLTEGSYTPLPHHLPPGTVLKERYLIGRVLGEGGFGITYIGCDLQLEVKIAVKEYFPVSKVSRNAEADLSVSCYTGAIGDDFEQDLDRFLREARTMAKLQKQSTIVSIHDFFRENNTAYIVMEYIDGITFKDLAAQRGGKIPAWELLYQLEPLFFDLQTMHEAGLIHRDISPENIMLENGKVRLLDFGCARDVNSDKTMTISLKHSYAPVEQYQGKGQGPWTDIYALGCTIYYCLTGVKPPQAMDRLVDDELVPPRKLGVDLTEGQEQALLKAIQVMPKRRYQSMQEFHAGLYEGIEKMPVPKPDDTVIDDVPDDEDQNADDPTSDTETKESRTAKLKPYLVILPLLGVLFLCLCLGVFQFFYGSDTAEESSLDSEDNADTDSEDEASEADSEDSEAGASGNADGDVAFHITDGDEESLYAALLDDDVTSIYIDASITLTGSGDESLYSGGMLSITKPVTVSEGCSLYSVCPITLDGVDLTLEVDSSLTMGSILRVINGGSLVLNEGVSVYNDNTSLLIWLENEDEIVCADGVDQDEAMPGVRVVTLVTDSLFEEAVQVSTEEALREALSDPDIAAVEITGDITLTEPVSQEKPVRVSEGVTLTVRGYDQTISEDGTIVYNGDGIVEENRNWLVQDTILVNCGTIIGDMYAYGSALVLNEEGAEIHVSGQIQDSSVLVNLSGGSVIWTHGWFYEETALYNLGDFTVEPYMETELDLYGVGVYNSGTWTLLTDNGYTSRMVLFHWAVFENFGTLEIGSDASLYNAAQIYNLGTIAASGDGATWENDGIVWNDEAVAGTIDLSGYEIDYSPGSVGVLVLYGEAALLLTDGTEADESTVGRVLDVGPDEEQEVVSTEEEFLDAIGDDSVSVICVDGDLTLDTDDYVVVEDKFIYARNSNITVTDAELCIMENAALVAYSVTCLSGQEVSFVTGDGGTTVLRTIDCAMDIVIRDSGLMLLTGHDGSTSLQDTTVTVLEDSQLTVLSDIAFENTTVVIDGEMRLFGDYTFDSDSKLSVNDETGFTYHLAAS